MSVRVGSRMGETTDRHGQRPRAAWLGAGQATGGRAVITTHRSRPFSPSLPPRNYRCKAWAVQAAEFLGPAPQEPAFPLVELA